MVKLYAEGFKEAEKDKKLNYRSLFGRFVKKKNK